VTRSKLASWTLKVRPRFGREQHAEFCVRYTDTKSKLSPLVAAVSLPSPTRSLLLQLLLLCGASPDAKQAGYIEQLAEYLGNFEAVELLAEWKKSADVWQGASSRGPSASGSVH